MCGFLSTTSLSVALFRRGRPFSFLLSRSGEKCAGSALQRKHTHTTAKASPSPPPPGTRSSPLAGRHCPLSRGVSRTVSVALAPFFHHAMCKLFTFARFACCNWSMTVQHGGIRVVPEFDVCCAPRDLHPNRNVAELDTQPPPVDHSKRTNRQTHTHTQKTQKQPTSQQHATFTVHGSTAKRHTQRSSTIPSNRSNGLSEGSLLAVTLFWLCHG